MEKCTQGEVNSTKIMSMEKRMGNVETAITDIRDRLLGRPTWIVTFALTALTSICVGLMIALLK